MNIFRLYNFFQVLVAPVCVPPNSGLSQVLGEGKGRGGGESAGKGGVSDVSSILRAQLQRQQLFGGGEFDVPSNFSWSTWSETYEGSPNLNALTSGWFVEIATEHKETRRTTLRLGTSCCIIYGVSLI